MMQPLMCAASKPHIALASTEHMCLQHRATQEHPACSTANGCGSNSYERSSKQERTRAILLLICVCAALAAAATTLTVIFYDEVLHAVAPLGLAALLA
jgi:hypothetical protein